MGGADRGIAQEVQPRLKSRLPGMMLAGLGRAKSDEHLDEGTLWGAISVLGMVGPPKFGVKGVCTPPMLYRAMDGKVGQLDL